MTYYRDEVVTAEHPSTGDCVMLGAGHAIIGCQCYICDEVFVEGDCVSLLLLGPGADATARSVAAAWQFYTAQRSAAHTACRTGVTPT